MDIIAYGTGLETDHVIPHCAALYTLREHSFGLRVRLSCEKQLAGVQKEAKQSSSETHNKCVQAFRYVLYMCVCSLFYCVAHNALLSRVFTTLLEFERSLCTLAT